MNIFEQLRPMLGKCECGKEHNFRVKDICIEENAVLRLPEFIKTLGAARPYIVSDVNTEKAAGELVKKVLADSGITFTSCVLKENRPMPEEKTAGSVILGLKESNDIIIAVGSGVINDTCKLISRLTGRPYILFLTAPSMDGIASGTSSMDIDGLKLSLPSHAADIIVCDINVLKNAPTHMLLSGLGDMLAKYVSLLEWKISALVTDEYYCEKIADMIRFALKRCVDGSDGLLDRDPEAVRAVTEGLIISGLSTDFSGNSRPASGVEHYYSHIWDMRHLDFGTPSDLHGIQCAIGTFDAAQKYYKLKSFVPDKQAAISFVREFDLAGWQEKVREFIGRGGSEAAENEKTERKFAPENHAKRIERIVGNWDRILGFIDEELPPKEELESLYKKLNMPSVPEDMGLSSDIIPMTFACTKDIRNKYILSTLLWDLGIIDKFK